MEGKEYLFMNEHSIVYRPIMDGLYWVFDHNAVDDSYSTFLFSPTFNETADDLIEYWKRANQ